MNSFSLADGPLVVAYPRRARASEHEVASHDALAARLAALLGGRHVPDYPPSRHRGGPVPYYVPDRCIAGAARATILGIAGIADLYGGVVPHAFVATKSISHGLARPDASVYVAPEENRALKACTAFAGDVLLVEAEHDSYIPHSTIMSYRSAFRRSHSLTHRIIDGADHALTEKPAQRAYTSILVNWVTEMVMSARMGEGRARY